MTFAHMNRDLEKMASQNHDILIVGGGIQGATIARDAAQRGLKVALIEKKDFSCGTSFASSKMLHGGLRYLANFEFALVREALRERRIWTRIAPHMMDPLPFMVPHYGSEAQKWFMRLGFIVYDLLSFDRKWLKDKDKQLPGHKRISKEEALELAPGLKPDGLIGGVIYQDCQIYAPERIAVECLMEAASLGAHIANHAEATEILKEGDRVIGAKVTDRISGTSHDINARLTINASGPWADYVLKSAEDDNPSRHLLRSKGIHVITRPLAKDTALLITVDGNHVLFLPWRGHTIIGTTDAVFVEHPDKVSAKEEDIGGLMEKAIAAYPNANLSRDDVKHFYAGLRPLVDPDGDPSNNANQDTYGASRAAEIVDHAEESGTEGLLSAIGGKWTTSRHIARQAVDKAIRKLGPGEEQRAPCRTADLPTWGGDIENFKGFVQGLKDDYPSWTDDIIDNLSRTYGTRAREIIDAAEANPVLRERLSNAEPYIGAEVHYVIQHEMAHTLGDIIMRRTGIGTLGRPGDDIISRIRNILKDKLHLTDDELDRQQADLNKNFETGEF